jgi:hypothetical protein
MGKPDSIYYICRKEQISFIVLCDQTLYFQAAEGEVNYTVVAAIIMALLASRAGIFLLLNVLFLIWVPVSVFRLSKEKGKVSV